MSGPINVRLMSENIRISEAAYALDEHVCFLFEKLPPHRIVKVKLDHDATVAVLRRLCDDIAALAAQERAAEPAVTAPPPGCTACAKGKPRAQDENGHWYHTQGMEGSWSCASPPDAPAAAPWEWSAEDETALRQWAVTYRARAGTSWLCGKLLDALAYIADLEQRCATRDRMLAGAVTHESCIADLHRAVDMARQATEAAQGRAEQARRELLEHPGRSAAAMNKQCPYDHPKERLAFADSLDPERARANIGPMWREWATAQIKPSPPAGYRDCPECAEQEAKP